MRLLSLLAIFLFFGNLNAQNKKYKELMEQDLANLKKYRLANEKLIENRDFPKVVFMGNSITEGWSNTHPEFFDSHDFLGRGISGQTTPQMLIRFIPDVVDLRPEAVVILAGTNDIAGNTGYSSNKMITDNIKAMAQLADKNGIEVILASILPVYSYPWRPEIEPVQKIAEINAWLKDFAENNQHTYLDFYSEMADPNKGLPKEYADDGVHPTDRGYRVMEPLVLEAISRALN
ncbi:MAG: SGNH/GDSL hydrolase family protein [Christiangramia sp.]|nr:SGNH/GDSL hydrolase family protein [Christiangramia sp.]